MKTLILALIFCCGIAEAQSGPTFLETWGSGGSGTSLCGFVAGNCAATWSLTAGSGMTIGTSSCGTGWSSTQQLIMPPSGTAITLTQVGVLPYIPLSSSSLSGDIWFEICPSANWTGGDAVINFLGTNGSGNAFSLDAQNSSGGYYLNGATPISATSGARQLWHVNFASNTTCKAQVNGGSYTTFTCIAKDFNEVQVGGRTSGQTVSIGNIWLNFPGYTLSAYPPSSLMDMSGGSNGTSLSTANMVASLHGGNNGVNTNQPGTAGSAGSGETLTYSSSNTCPSFASALTLNGSTYTGNVGLVSDHYVPSGSSPGLYWSVPIQSVYSNVAVGFCFSTVYAGTTTAFDTQRLGSVNVLNVCDSIAVSGCVGTSGLTNHLICFESLWTSSDQMCAQGTAANANYWITLLALGGSSPQPMYANVYALNSNGTVGTLLGTSQGTSSTSLAVGTGSKTFTVGQTNLMYISGSSVEAISQSSGATMSGSLTSYTGTTLVLNVASTSGSGTYSDWSLISYNFGGWASDGYFGCGAFGGEIPQQNVHTICGNVVFQYANEAWPVLPPAAPPSGARGTGIVMLYAPCCDRKRTSVFHEHTV